MNYLFFKVTPVGITFNYSHMQTTTHWMIPYVGGPIYVCIYNNLYLVLHELDNL
jgi:hypothetical protein